jgi:hypothetical protein
VHTKKETGHDEDKESKDPDYEQEQETEEITNLIYCLPHILSPDFI